MKKVILIFMSFVMLMSFAGCSDDTDYDNNDSNVSGVDTTKSDSPTQTDEVEIITTDLPVTDNDSDSESDKNESDGVDNTSPERPQDINFENLSVGDEIKFGFYEQDGIIENGTEEIVWEVHKIDGDKAFLLSKYGLASEPYNERNALVTWETCTLRKWLNSDFYNSAFGENHKKMIIKSKVTDFDNQMYGTKYGNDTEDWIFLLSIHEVNELFKFSFDRRCTITPYANYADKYEVKSWWLRSPGEWEYEAAFVYTDGTIVSNGIDVSFNEAVRPAMWINIG